MPRPNTFATKMKAACCAWEGKCRCQFQSVTQNTVETLESGRTTEERIGEELVQDDESVEHEFQAFDVSWASVATHVLTTWNVRAYLCAHDESIFFVSETGEDKRGDCDSNSFY